MNRYLLGLLLLSLFFSCKTSKSHKTQNPLSSMTYDAYEEIWHLIDSLERSGLYESAFKKTEALADKAHEEKNAPQIVKTTLYRCKYIDILKEDGDMLSLKLLRSEVERAPFPAKPLLQSILAEAYASFLDYNRWKIQNRTEMDAVGEEPETWPAGEFERRSNELYFQSVSDLRIQNVPVELFKDITLSGRYDSGLRPTLYDLLVHRALDHFANERSYLHRPAYAFYIEAPEAFSKPQDFVNWSIATSDTTSYKYLALKLFQDLLRFRLERQEEMPFGREALLDADLKRLQFVYDNGVQADKAQLYVEALEQRKNAFGESPLLSDVMAALAQWYYDAGKKYEAGMLDETYRYHWRKALEICEACLARPKDENQLDKPGRIRCEALRSQLLTKSLKLEVEQIYLPDKPALAKVSFRNITNAYFKLLPYNKDVEKKISREIKEHEAQITYLNSLQVIWQKAIELPKQDDLHQHSTEIALPPRQNGQYLLMVSNNEKFAYGAETGYAILTYSTLGFWQRNLPNGISDFFVFDRQSGQPLQGVVAEAWVSDYRSISRTYVWKKVARTTSDKEGHFQFKLSSKHQNFRLKLVRGDDELFLSNNFYSYNYRRQREGYDRTVFFLDRAIYRPGQTVFFKALLLTFDKDEKPHIRAKEKITVLLRDANFQELAKLELVSNEYGTISGSFVLPSSGLLGNMFLESSVGGHRQSFRVEEYKRPTFFVQTEPVKTGFRLGETVKLPGKAEAYAGYPLDGATVSYRVVREVSFPWLPWWYWYKGNPWSGESAEIARGKTTTDASGQFEVSFKALPDRSIPRERKPEFIYTVYVDVTDITGETHSTQTRIKVGTVALQLQLHLPEQMESKDLHKLAFEVTNLQGEPQQASGKLIFEQLQPPPRPLIERYWEEPDLWLISESDFRKQFPNYSYRNESTPAQWAVQRKVLERSFKTDGKVEWMLGKQLLPAGVYRIRIQTQDPYGTVIEKEFYLKLYNTDKKEIPLPAVGWHVYSQRAYEPGEEAVLHFGTALEQQPVLLEIERDGQIIRREWTDVRGLVAFRQKITEDDRGNLQYLLHYAALNRQYQVEGIIQVPWSNKELKIEYRSFRDKLLPGQEEVWEIVISGPKGEKVAAELLATMYDASLDAFVSKPWNLRVWPVRTYVQNSLQAYGYQSVYPRWLSSQSRQSYAGDQIRVYRKLNLFGCLDRRSYGFAYREVVSSASDIRLKMQVPAEAMMEEEAPDSAKVPLPAADEKVVEEATAKDDNALGKMPVRENLRETVFFMPELRTDAEGRIVLRFTMNEALTRWKFQLFAHTPDLKYALDTREVVTQKDLMIVPHPPRFLREGDEIEFTAKVVNLSSKTLHGNAALQMINPINSIPVYKWLDNPQFNKTFTVEAGSSTVVAWSFKVPPVEEVPLIEYTVEASSGEQLDAERNLLPVLTDRMLVTESMPLPVRGGEHKTFVFKRMQDHGSTTLKHYGLTLEFTSNPAWYAVQALPYLMEYPYDCSEQIFARYYANTLAASIANSQPRIKEVFEAWSEADLQSPLSKNQELKSALLEETPWVLDAQSEEEQRKNIALLFDLHRMAKERAKAIDQLRKRQLANGGFAWFDGGRDSWYITQYIVEGIAHLDRLGALQVSDEKKLQRMLQRAVAYLDEQLLESYQDLVQAVKRGHTKWEDDHLTPIIVHYLYTRSFFLDRNKQAGLGLVGGGQGYLALPEKIHKAFHYYMDQTEKHWLKKSIYQQGMLALAAHRMEKTVANKIMRSLKERAIEDEEMGMYWKTARGYYWYQHPIEQQALLIETFSEVSNDAKAVDAMKVWLLKHKQTNAWRTTKATAEAIYALLSFGDNWLAEEKPVNISLGGANQGDVRWNEQIAEAQKNAMPGTGYFKLRFQADEMDEQMAVVEVENPNKHVAWGALYWQYFEELGNITTFEETPLKLKRALFKVVLTDKGEQLVGLSANETLSPGDKVRVRIELRVDRSMEYVHMRDMRASGFEPINVLSRYKWQGGLGYYESTRDASTDFFFSYLPKGTYVFEYTLRVAHRGKFSNGITTIQCMYAPEFSSHSEGLHLQVK